MFQRLVDARVVTKVLVVPVLFAVSMVLLAGVFHWGIARQGEALAEITRAIDDSRVAAEAKSEAAVVQSNIYRLIGWVGARQGKAGIDALSTEIERGVGKLAGWGPGLAAAEGIAGGAGLGQTIEDFQSSVADVLEAARRDHVTALGMMEAVEHDYQALREKLDRLAAQTDRRVTDVSADSASLALRTEMQFLLFLAVVLAAGLVVTLAMARLIVEPVAQLTAVMGRLAQGDTQVDVPLQAGRCEIGAMARSVVVFRDGMERASRLEAEQRREAEDKAARLVRREEAIERFRTAMASGMAELLGTVLDVNGLSSDMQSSAVEATRLSETVAAAASEASTDLHTVAAAAQQFEASVLEISRQVTESTRITGEAVDGVEFANVTMAGLDQAAGKIGQIIGLINAIAGQTNLLALNATIEAARAGDAGKGFAVVASEVKSLANETARATDEIASQVSGIQAITRDAIGAIEAVGRTIEKVNAVASSIAAMVSQQSASTGEIVRSVQSVADGNGIITSRICEVSDAAKGTGARAEKMFAAAGELTTDADNLKREVGIFLGSLAAAD